jgi:hypothetical protein
VLDAIRVPNAAGGGVRHKDLLNEKLCFAAELTSFLITLDII